MSIAAVVGIAWGLKRKKEVSNIINLLESESEKNNVIRMQEVVTTKCSVESVKEVRAYTPPKDSYVVNMHKRVLKGGKHHSLIKAKEAEELGITLLPNETLVDSYTKYAA